jgi:hypothetical protein
MVKTDARCTHKRLSGMLSLIALFLQKDGMV